MITNRSPAYVISLIHELRQEPVETECEERGSGWDKVATQVEQHRLPAPLVEVGEGGLVLPCSTVCRWPR